MTEIYLLPWIEVQEPIDFGAWCLSLTHAAHCLETNRTQNNSKSTNSSAFTARARKSLYTGARYEWRDLRERARPSLKSLLLGPEPRGDMNIPPRGRRQRRTPKPIG